MTTTVDLTTLSDEQLAAFFVIDNKAAAREKLRRMAFGSWSEALSDVAQIHLDLANLVEGMKQTPAIKAVKSTGILTLLERLLGTGIATDVEFKEPKLNV